MNTQQNDKKQIEAYPIPSYAGKPLAWLLEPENWASLAGDEQEDLTKFGCASWQEEDFNGQKVRVGLHNHFIVIDARTFPSGCEVPISHAAMEHDGLIWWLFSTRTKIDATLAWRDFSRWVAKAIVPVFADRLHVIDQRKWRKHAK